MEGGSTGRPLRRRNATVASRNAALLSVLVLLGSVPASSGEITPLAVPGVELAVGPGDIALSSSYIVAGDVPWVNTTVHNLGDTTANGTLQLFLGSPPSGAPFASVNFTVGADSTVTVPAQFNTAGLEGIRTVTARAVAVTPTEGGSLQNNEASAEARVHARFGEVNLAGTQTAFINTFYPRTAFVTVRDNATLTVGPLGNLSIGQLYANQFDLRVEGYGVLRISGGAVTANLPLRIVLADNATLIVEDASFVGVSIRSTTAGLMQFGSARLSAPELVVDGSTVALDGTDVQVDRADFSRVALTAQGASVAALAPITVRGASQAVLTNTRVSVASSFASPAQAEGAFPGISGYLGQLSVPFQPALHFTEASTGNFTRTSVDSTLAVAGTLHTSSVPILAEGGATVAFNRVARVTVTDPTGAPVPNATVDVFDYLVNDSLIVSALAADGVAQIELPSEFLENGAPHFVGTYYIQATRASASSPKVALTFALFPDLSAASLLSDLSIPLPLFAPWGLYAEDAPPVVYAADTSLSGEVLWTTDVQIHAALSLETADATLAQSRDFEHYVVVTDGGSLSANFSTIHSDFAFNLYILNGSSAQLTGTGLVRGNLLLFGAGTLALTDARVVGSAIGDAQSVASTNSFFWGRSVDLTAPEIHWQSTVAAAQQLVALQATNMTLVDVGLTGRFVPFDALNQTALSFGAFDALADDTFEGLLDAPAVRLSSPFLSAGPLTVWTQGALTVSAGPAGATVLRLRALVSSVQFQLSAVTLAINGINVPSGSALSFTGSGTALVQGIAAPRPSVGPGVTVVWYASVPVTVVDSFGLPVPGATVSAAPISGGGETPTALTDELGIATIDIPAITITSASSQTGPNYRLNATKDGATSVSISWDPESTESFTLTLPGSFAAVSGTSYFAVVAALSPSVNRVVASNVPDAASLAAFLEGHGIAPATLNFTATVFPGQAVEAYFAADYVYTQGSSATSRPMAGESVTFANDGVPAGTVVLDADGQALASFALPGSPGPHNLTATVPAGGLAAPLVATASYSLVDLPQLALVTSRIRTPVNASESIFVIGQVTYLDGSPAPFATITITYAPNKTRVNVTNEGGNYFVLLVAPASPGNYEITIVATRANARDSEPYSTPYTVQPAGGVKPPGLTQPFNYLPVVLGAAFFAVCMAVFAVALIQRRAARGEFVECGSCEKLTLATDKKCRHCGVEFETNLAKCSKCQAWIPSNVSECPQCHAVFSTQPEVGEKPTVTPSIAAPADFAAPITVPMAGRKTPPAQLEDLEFRLPGTTDTMDLGEKGSSPTFAATGGATPAPRPALNAAALSPDVPLERMGLPRHDEPASPVREVSSMEGGEPTRHDAVSLGTGNVDLSRTTAAATSTKSGAPDAPPDIDENVLRELLMKAAPELSDDVFPGDIRKELEEIARSEAPAAAERKSAAARGARTPPAPSPALDERPVEAPEKSRKSAFDVFQTPAKNIPVGYEKRGGSPGKDQAPKGGAPVCPNCGGNWVVQRDGKNSCRVCGTRW